MFQHIISFIRNDNPKAQVTWSLYGRVWKECGLPYWKWLAAAAMCAICAAAAEAYSVMLVKQIADNGIINPNTTTLALLGLQVIAAFSVKSIFGYAKTLIMAKAAMLGVANLRRRLYKHMVKQPMAFFHEARTGMLIQFFTKKADNVLGLVTESVISAVSGLATLLMMLGLMVWYAPQMTCILLFLVPAVLIPLVIIIRKQRVLIRSELGAGAQAISHLNQSISGVKTIQSYGTEDTELQNMNELENRRMSKSFKSLQLSALQTPLLEIMISIGLCLALIYGGHLITSGAMTPGAFMAFLVALLAIYKPGKSITSIGWGIQRGLISAEGLFKFMDRESEIVDAPDAIELQPAPTTVKLDNVFFAYNKKDGNVLRKVSLRVKPGTVCAFVGPSGGGKSTLFNLISRFYDPQKGIVLFNGTDIRTFTLASLHKNIATVSQDVFLFDGTLADNIKYGSPEATQEQIESAAKAANAHEFIMEFPEQYNNPVGERGSLLSGGQKQRIAIARAILKDAPILLLDEATSALDSQSEQHIQAALKNLMRGRTTFVIAHRLSTVLDADVICVVKKGRIIEKGTDAELYKLGGEYKKLKDIQFSNSESV